jgi:micrococcal nuclease
MSFWQKLFGISNSQQTEQKKGTKIADLQVLDVIDGDTIRVDIRGQNETLRLSSVDTEESRAGSNKPVTRAGELATKMAKQYFRSDGDGWCKVDISFDTDHSIEQCLSKYRDTYNRLICYVYKGEENYNLMLVRDGWSPYYAKYGRSRLYHREFCAAEAEAQAHNRVVWDPRTNEGGASRNYKDLLSWWENRGSITEEFRLHGQPNGALCPRLDYDKISAANGTGQKQIVFCDLQYGISKVVGNGAAIYVGSKDMPFNLWIPNTQTADSELLLRLIDLRYKDNGRGYVYVRGEITSYRDRPQIEITNYTQLFDYIPEA